MPSVGSDMLLTSRRDVVVSLIFRYFSDSFHKHLFFCRIFATEDVKEIFERVELHDGPGGASVFHDQTSKSGLIS